MRFACEHAGLQWCLPNVFVFPRAPLSQVAGRALAGVAAVVAATLARAAVEPVLETQSPFAFHIAAVVVAAWVAGFEGAFVSTVGSALAVNYFIMDARYALSVQPADLAGTAVFALVAGTIGWQTARWRAAERALLASREAMRERAERLEFQATLLEHAHDAISVRAADDTLTLWNRGAAQLYGWSAGEAVGRRVDDLLQTDVSTEREVIDALARTGVWSGQIRQRRKDGTPVVADSHQARIAAGSILAVNRDVTERERTLEALRENERRLTALMDASTESIWLVDRRTVLAANATAVKRTGRPFEELQGTRWQDLLPADVAAARTVRIEEVYRTKKPVRFEDDRAGMHFDHTFFPVFSEAGDVVAVATFSRDVTGQRRAEEELRAQAEQLLTANRLKDDFLATLSHELRTPINAILGWAQILQTGGLAQDRVRHGLDTIARNARLQAQLVEDLLDVSRIVTGSVRLDVQAVDIRQIIEHALDAVRPGAEAKQLRVSVATEPGLTLSADPVRLQQVLWNLLSNAVKFTPSRGAIHVSAHRRGGDVEVSVSDTGAGIGPDFLPHVFERFRQADSSPTRIHGGLGLGLAIVRHIVELHGGTVGVASDGLGRGTTFTVRLPAKPAPAAVNAGAGVVPIDRLRADLSGLRVLVVDDDPDAREVVSTLLGAAGGRVQCVASAGEALALLPEFKPHVLISDIAMPGTDGYAFIRTVRQALSPHARVPAVALTAYGSAADRQTALSAGYDRHIAKPVSGEDLVSTVASLAAQERA